MPPNFRGQPNFHVEPWDAADAIAIEALLESVAGADRPPVVGLAGAQGSGKSTMARRLVGRLETLGIRCALLSLDDCYLTRAERCDLARTVHPLLATRGVPGTHDVPLLMATLDALAAGRPVAVPRFDKARDDRLREWERLTPPYDLVLLEGWCLGATPQPAAALAVPINALEREEDGDGRWRRWVNDQLAGPYAKLFDRLAPRLFLRAPSFDVVSNWRAEQEASLQDETGARAMTDVELRRFVAHYERITCAMLADPPADLVIELDAARTPVIG